MIVHGLPDWISPGGLFCRRAWNFDQTAQFKDTFAWNSRPFAASDCPPASPDRPAIFLGERNRTLTERGQR
jgi:hypothetical protein